MLTENERAQCSSIAERVQELRRFLASRELAPPEQISAWYEFLSTMRLIQGNLSNDVSYVATLMAKQYLAARFDIEHFDAAEKPQGAPGVDIDVRTRDGQRINRLRLSSSRVLVAHQTRPDEMPTVLRSGPYRVYFFSHEPNEPPHVHVDRDDCSAKFWLQPLALARNFGFAPHELRKVRALIENNLNELLEAWHGYPGAKR